MFTGLNISQVAKENLIAALQNKKLSHAIILQSLDQKLCLDAANQIALSLVCQSENKPCLTCNACKKALSGIHPDIHIINACESEKDIVKVDSIRQLKSKALMQPNEAAKSIFIIHGADKMNAQAQNALLKIFEEPSSFVQFILTCPAKLKLLDTIVSRATFYSLGNEATQEKDEHMQQAHDLAAKFLKCLCVENELQLIKLTSDFQKDKMLFKQTVSSILPLLADAIILKSNFNEIKENEIELAQSLSKHFSLNKLLKFYEQTKEFVDLFERAANHNLFVARFVSCYYSIKLS